MFINETIGYTSPYENDLRRIFNDKNKSKAALASSWDKLSIFESIRDYKLTRTRNTTL